MFKYLAALVVSAGLLPNGALAADFLTGQAARALIGQPYFNSQITGGSDSILGAVGGLAYASNTLFVADANRLGLLPNNNRVLLFNNVQQMLPPADAEIPDNSGRCPVCGGTASVVVGQPDFTTVADVTPPKQTSLRLPTALASDGKILAIADTANNRILIWRSIPAVNGGPADVVLGQADFATVARNNVTASSLRGPQGVWIQGSRLYVADTQNNRILIWNSIPTQNNQPADLVLGQPNFTTAPQINQVDLSLPATASIMLSPVSVTSDSTRLYVTDLGYNRVLIWNSLPTRTQQPADVEIGQLNFTVSIANDAKELCAPSGTDSSGNATYPSRCAATLSFPRYALSDGARLFVADGGNDRVLVYNSIPTQNAARADAVLGEPDEFSDVFSTNGPLTLSSADVTPTPTSLAWDGQNLYVADGTDYRILVFTPETPNVPLNSIVNAASRAVYAAGFVIVGGTITEKNTVTITINGTGYTYTVLANDTVDKVAKALTALINGVNGGPGDNNVAAYEENGVATVRLVARKPGTDGNNVNLSTSTSTSATETLTTSGSTLQGGGSAAQVAPGTVVLVRGTNLADQAVAADPNAAHLPFGLGGVQLYFDGIRAPLFSVSPTEIKAQIPFDVTAANSVTSWVRTKHADGSVTVSTAINVPVVEANPGLFADETPGAPEPRFATAIHSSSFATGTISVDGSAQVGDIGTITIGDNTYSYTVVTNDTLVTIRDALINSINANPEELVVASAAPLFTRIQLRAKVPGPAGNGISLAVSVSTAPTNNQGVQIALTATNTATCCANVAGALITPDNPAVPGETIILYGTGLGLITPEDARLSLVGRNGFPYQGPAANSPMVSVSSTAATATGTVLSAGMKPGQIGVYEIVVEINNSASVSQQAQFTISQGFNTSNIVAVPLSPPAQQ